MPIEHGMVTKSIERAQKQVEAQNFAIRKHLLEYDDVMNKQREAIYGMRRMILEGKNTREHVLDLADEIVEWFLENYCSEKDSRRTAPREPAGHAQGHLRPDRLPELRRHGPRRVVPTLAARVPSPLRGEGAADRPRAHALPPADADAPDRGRPVEGPPVLARPPEGRHRPAVLRPARPPRRVQEGVLQHLPGPHGPDRRGDPALDLPLPAGRRRPSAARAATHRSAARAAPARSAARPGSPSAGHDAVPRNLTFNDRRRRRPPSRERRSRGGVTGGTDDVQTVRREGPKVGRNDPCPCGSGKKYKKCHGTELKMAGASGAPPIPPAAPRGVRSGSAARSSSHVG